MVTRDPETYSSSLGGVLLDKLQTPEEREGFRTIIDVDPPEHTRLRRLVNRAFTPRAIAEFGGQYRAVVGRILGEAMRESTFDFVTEGASQPHAFAISELLGVPEEDRDRINNWTNQMSGG